MNSINKTEQGLFKSKSLVLFSMLLISNSSIFPTSDATFTDFNGKIFDLSGIIAVPENIDATSAEKFATLAEQMLATINTFNPLTDVPDFDLFQFNKALRGAKNTASTNPIQTKISRINTVYDKLNKFMTDRTKIDLGSISSVATSTTDSQVFKQLSTYTSEKYRYLQNLKSMAKGMTTTEAIDFANEVLAVVSKEAAGIIDTTQFSSIKSRLKSILSHDYIAQADTTNLPSGTEKPKEIIQKAIDFMDKMTMANRIDFLDRIWDNNDNVFDKSDGETRFLNVLDYVVQRFTTLTADQKDDLYSILDEASTKSSFSDNTHKVVGNLLKSQDWFASSTTTTPATSTNSSSSTQTTTPVLTVSELRTSIETSIPALSTKLVSLAAESAYDAFLTELETTVSNYRQLVESGEIKLVPPAGTIKDPLIGLVENLAERVFNNYRFQGANFKDRVTNIYNLAKGNLSLEQKIARFTKDQQKVASDNDAISLVNRIKNEIIYNEDGTPKQTILGLSNDKKTLLTNYLNSLLSADFFGAAAQDIANMKTTVSSGVVIDQVIADVASKLEKVTEATSMNTFLVALRNLKSKFDEFRAKGIITQDQNKKMVDLLQSTQTGARYWAIQSGVVKAELLSMISSLKNPLDFTSKIEALRSRLANIQANPDSITLDYLNSTKTQIDDLVNEWNLARALGSNEASNNANILSLLDVYSKSDEFYDFRSSFTTMINQIKAALSTDQKITLIFGLMDSVLNSSDPAPKLIDNFVLSTKLLTSDLKSLTTAKMTELLNKINTARTSDKFSSQNKTELLSYENMIKDYQAKNTNSTTPTTTTTGSSSTNSSTTTSNTTGNTASNPTDQIGTVATPPAAGTVSNRGTPRNLSMTRGRAPIQGGTKRTSSYEEQTTVSPSLNTKTRGNVSQTR